MRDRLLSRLGRWVVAHVWWVMGVAVLLTVASVALLPRLDIRTSRSALYPKDVEVNQRWAAYLENFATTNSLIAVVQGAPEDLGPFAELLAEELRKETAVIQGVFFRADIEFFADRAFLFLPVEQMRKLRNKVVEHREEVSLFARINGLVPLLEAFSKVDSSAAYEAKIDIDAATKILAAGKALFEEFELWLDDPARTEIGILDSVFVEELSGRDYDLSGYMRSYDREMLFVFIQPVSNSEEFDAVHALVEGARGAAARATERWTTGDRAAPTVGFTGLPKIADEETLAIRHDVVFTAAVATVLILLIIILGFRSLRRGIQVLVPMLLAGVWNLGLTVFTVGHLTILTAGITAILFGLGVDYGIFLSGLIQENRQKGMELRAAIIEAVRFGGRTLVTAGGTTTLAFFVIGTVPFTGFAEMGIVTGTGVVLVILAMLLLLPAMAVVFPSTLRESRVDMEAAAARFRLPAAFSWLFSLVVVGVTVLSLIAAIPFEIDFDLMNILPKGSEAIALQKEMSARSDYSGDFVAAIAADEAEARIHAEALVGLSTVKRVESVTMLLPEDQEEKIALMREVGGIFDKIKVSQDELGAFTAADLAEALDAFYEPLEEAQERAFAGNQKEIVKGLDEIIGKMDAIVERLEKNPGATARARAFEASLFQIIGKAVAQVERWREVGPLTAEDLPEDILNRFRGNDGRYVTYVFPTGTIYDVEFLDEFLGQVYEIAPESTGFPSTHQVFSRMIFDGFLQALTYAVLVVILMLFLDFRRPGYTLAALLPLGLGAAWMLGLMYLFKIRHNYANIIALPLIIGLAVDYGVFITHRLRAEQNHGPFVTIQRAGRAVILAALTTLAGIGAICMAEHQGAASLGIVLILGICSCLVAAIVVLPVIASLVRDLWERGAGDDDSRSG
jgi:hopanoid biosynthesis associated RND transporter like protein HpnN